MLRSFVLRLLTRERDGAPTTDLSETSAFFVEAQCDSHSHFQLAYYWH